MSDGTKITGDRIDPRELFIYGIDPLPEGLSAEVAEARFGHLADPVHIGLALPEDLLQNLKRNGTRRPVVVQSFRLKLVGEDKRIKVVIDGRTRVRCVREINRALEKSGARDEALHRIPYIIQPDADDLDPLLQNYPGRRDGPIAVAKLAKHMKSRGRSVTDVLNVLASADGKTLTKATLANYESLLRLPLEIQASVEAGETPVSGAYALARLDGHPAMLEAWRSTAEPPADDADEDDDDAPAAPPAPPTRRKAKDVAAAANGRIIPPTAKQVATLAELCKPAAADEAGPDDLYTIVAAALDWACGRRTLESLESVDADLYAWATKAARPKGAPTTKASSKGKLPKVGKEVV